MKIIAADKIITGDKRIVLKNSALIINDSGVIVRVGNTEEIIKEYGSQNFEMYEGSSILPGMIDMHTHIGYWQREKDSNICGACAYDGMDKAFYAYAQLQEAIKSGVTTIRDLGSPDGLIRALQKALKKGYITGPRIIGSNCAIARTGGHGYELSDTVIEADGVEEVRKTVRYNVKSGAYWIKVMGSDGPRYCQYTKEELETAVAEAHMLGQKCAMHATTLEATKLAIEVGIDTIEHSNFLYPELAKIAAEKKIAWDPTLYIHLYCYKNYVNRKDDELDDEAKTIKKLLIDTMDSYKENFLENYKTGIKIVTGTDSCVYGYPATPVDEELILMVELGLSPLEAIECATKTPAEVLGLEGSIGMIKEGLMADYIIVKGNPDSNIKDIKNIQRVFRDGKLLYRS